MITVGKKADSNFASLWEKYSGKFEAHDSCRFPPIMVSFTNEEGEKLKNAEVTWSNNSTAAVEKELVNKLEEGKAFVFYRNGSFSGVKEDSKQALDVIFYEIYVGITTFLLLETAVD